MKRIFLPLILVFIVLGLSAQTKSYSTAAEFKSGLKAIRQMVDDGYKVLDQAVLLGKSVNEINTIAANTEAVIMNAVNELNDIKTFEGGNDLHIATAAYVKHCLYMFKNGYLPFIASGNFNKEAFENMKANYKSQFDAINARIVDSESKL